jgi:uncharacterized damage-inducible protein DinB
MKKFKSEELINSLKVDVATLLQCVQFFKQQPKDVLLQQPAEGKWSVIQVLEHLNSYGRIYLPNIDKALTTNLNSQRDAWFTPGFFGNFFTNSMRPKDLFEIKNKMKTPKNHAPDSSLNANAVIEEFVSQQYKLLQLLDLSKERSLNTIRIPISITKLIKLKLGDTFRFLIAHEQRHFIQARNALHAVGVSTSKFPVILQAVRQ